MSNGKFGVLWHLNIDLVGSNVARVFDLRNVDPVGDEGLLGVFEYHGDFLAVEPQAEEHRHEEDEQLDDRDEGVHPVTGLLHPARQK